MAKSKKPGWIDWSRSVARRTLLDDLSYGGCLNGQDHLTAKEIWSFYTEPQRQEGFETLTFEQFRSNLYTYRKNNKANARKSAEEEMALEHDRKLYPRSSVNNRGEPVFDMLRDDVENKLHEGIKPEVFQKTRPEYMVFKPRIFRHRIYQERRRQKYINWLKA